MNRSIKSVLLRWLPALAWMCLIFWFSSQSHLPHAPNNLLDLLMKKGAHFSEYGILALCYLNALGDSGTPRSRRYVALFLTMLYAISDEYHQSWTPLRHPSPIDVLIDTAGGWTALWLILPWVRRRTGGEPEASLDRSEA